MRKKIWILLSFLILQVDAFQSSAAIGDWKAYMAYSEVQEIEEAGNWIFVQASSNLYAYNRNDQSIQTFSKMDFLNDCDIQHIAYNKAAGAHASVRSLRSYVLAHYKSEPNHTTATTRPVCERATPWSKVLAMRPQPGMAQCRGGFIGRKG